MLSGLLAFLVYAVILAVVIYATKVVLDMVDLPPPVKTLIWLVVMVLAVIGLVTALTHGPYPVLSLPR
jgi:hypothetical protein